MPQPQPKLSRALACRSAFAHPSQSDPGMHTVDRAGVNVVGLQAGVGSDAGSVACRTLAASLSNETARCAR